MIGVFTQDVLAGAQHVHDSHKAVQTVDGEEAVPKILVPIWPYFLLGWNTQWLFSKSNTCD